MNSAQSGRGYGHMVPFKCWNSLCQVLANQLLISQKEGVVRVKWQQGRVANPRPVATIKTGCVAQPITDAFWHNRS